MARRPPTREWRDDIPRSFSYTPPAPVTPASRQRSTLRLLLSIVLHR